MTLTEEWQEFFEAHSSPVSEVARDLEKGDEGIYNQTQVINEWMKARDLREDELFEIATDAVHQSVQGAMALGRLDAVPFSVALSMFQFGFEVAAKRYANQRPA